MNENTLNPKSVAHYKAKYQSELAPIFEMINHKKSELTQNEWSGFVTHVKNSIINSPSQYVTDPLPPGIVLETVLNELFENIV